jgi:hypothetical protein
MRGSTNAGAARAYAVELLALTPDIIVASGTQGAIALKQLTRAVPIVFNAAGAATNHQRALQSF